MKSALLLLVLGCGFRAGQFRKHDPRPRPDKPPVTLDVSEPPKDPLKNDPTPPPTLPKTLEIGVPTDDKCSTVRKTDVFATQVQVSVDDTCLPCHHDNMKFLLTPLDAAMNRDRFLRKIADKFDGKVEDMIAFIASDIHTGQFSAWVLDKSNLGEWHSAEMACSVQ